MTGAELDNALLSVVMSATWPHPALEAEIRAVYAREGRAIPTPIANRMSAVNVTCFSLAEMDDILGAVTFMINDGYTFHTEDPDVCAKRMEALHAKIALVVAQSTLRTGQ